MRSKSLLAAFVLCLGVIVSGQNYDAPPSYVPTAEEIKAIRDGLGPLEAKLKGVASHPRYSDAAIYAKAADWILRHPEEFYQKVYAPNALKVIETGMSRAADLAAGRTPWVDQKGKPVARAYVSRLDGSLQPYQVTVPASYNGSPIRLDVVLHGRNARLNEVSFLSAVETSKAPVLEDRIELQVYGRTNNAYRWAGEADVFEAIEAVKRDYKIDDKRVVLRGFSMGGAGTWHLGLHYPHLWAGIEAGAGFSETLRYAKQSNAPEYQRRAWPIYDAYLYARNALLVPTVGYGSIDDPQLQASVNVKEQLAKENQPDVPALFLVGPKIGHRFAPEKKAESEAWISEHLPKQMPSPAKFLTYTTRYGRYDWLLVDGLERHYDRAEVEATRDGNAARLTTRNVSRVVFRDPLTVTIDGESVGSNIRAVEKHEGKWKKADVTPKTLRKRYGLQGPIDDAFLDSFLCVKGTGNARDTTAHGAAMERLSVFQKNWDKFLRGDVRLKTDRDVTADDAKHNNLILFGDPGSNALVAKAVSRMPVKWDRGAISVGTNSFKGDGLLLVAIYPNPSAPDHYVVLNSGHTFGATELKGTNALLFPRLGDWAVLDAAGKVLGAGFFDENWK